MSLRGRSCSACFRGPKQSPQKYRDCFAAKGQERRLATTSPEVNYLQTLMVCVSGSWAGVDGALAPLGSRKNAKPENYSMRSVAANPTCPCPWRAVLGVFEFAGLYML